MLVTVIKILICTAEMGDTYHSAGSLRSKFGVKTMKLIIMVGLMLRDHNGKRP